MKKITTQLTLILLFMLLNNLNFGQELSNLAKNYVDQLENEYLPDLKSRKQKIESNRKNGPAQECNDFIGLVNNAVGVLNKIPKSEYSHPSVKKVDSAIDEYIAFAAIAQEIFKERKEVENNKGNNFKAGEKVCALYNGDWMEGTYVSSESGVVTVDVTAPSMYKGSQKLPANTVYSYWPYVEFIELMTKTEKSKIFKFLSVMYEVCGDCARNMGIVNLNGNEILEAAKEIDYVESVLKKYPPIPADNNLKDDYSTNPKTYAMVVSKKKGYLEKKYGEMIKQHLDEMEKNDFSPTSILTRQQLTYENKETIFWSDLICKSDAPIKKAILADVNNYLKDAGLPQNGESYFTNWDGMVAKIKSKKQKEADEPLAWKSKYTFSDPVKEKLVKSTFGQDITNVKFNSNQPSQTATNTNGSMSRETNGLYFKKIPGCSYYQWVKVVCYQKYTGGAWGPMQVTANSSGYTKNP
jgi:hypothetical protein